MSKGDAPTWNRGRYWAATIALCAVLVYSSVLTLRDPTSSARLAGEIGVPTFIGTYVLATIKIVCAAIILQRGFPKLRLFAYAVVLTYLVLDLIGMLSVQEWYNVTTGSFKLLLWALAFWWDRDRIHRQRKQADSSGRSVSA